MDLTKLQEIGGFVPSAPVKKEVIWQPVEGESVTFTVHIKKLSAGSVERLWSDTRKDRSHAAALIAESVLLGDEGTERIPYDKAFELELSLANVLMEAVDSVNPTKAKTVAAAKN